MARCCNTTQYADISRQFYTNQLLFGDLADAGTVATEIVSVTQVEVFRRIDGNLTRERRPLRLFALGANRELFAGLRAGQKVVELAGDFQFRYLVEFGSTDGLEAARLDLRNATGKGPGAPDAPYLILADPIEQHLMLTGGTSFMQMQFADLHRMQIAIEVYVSAGFEFPMAARESDRIIALALTDSQGFARVLSGREMDERTILLELVRIIRERDPDVIEGHNLFRFVLEYLEARARRYKVKLALGRNDSVVRGRASRMQIAERTIAYRRYEAYGRSLIDTWLLAQHYDIASRELESFALNDLARHFGAARPDRVYLDAMRISDCFEREPERVLAHTLDNARETASLAESLSPSYFVQAQIFPYSYQNVVLRGNATKIDALLMRAYLAARHSIPAPNEPTEVAGGYTEVRRTGVARNVLHCDVTSLYPSLMLEGRHAPGNDRIGVFLKMLSDLRSFRIQTKAAVRELDGNERRNLEALQQTFKILINSFYGYLGFSLGHFNDFVQANVVTRRGRELIQRAILELEARDALVVEVDTDGIYFVASFPLENAEEAQSLLDQVGLAMPAGIRLEIDGRYPAMLSYKMKNYVLLDEQGELTIRGSGLKSRGLERFQRRFMEELFCLLLTGKAAEVPQLHQDYRNRIERHALGITELAKTETLQDSIETYQQKRGGSRRNIAAAYELALKANRAYLSGDQVSYYVTGESARVKVANAARMIADYDPAHPDENIAYYLGKLDSLYEKFRPFVERNGLFSPPSRSPLKLRLTSKISSPRVRKNPTAMRD